MIRTRLTLWNAVALAVVLTVLGLVAFLSTRASLYGAVDEDLQRRGEFLARGWKDFPERPPEEPRPRDRREPSVAPAEFRRVEFESIIARPRIQRIGKQRAGWDAEPYDPAAIQAAFRGETRLFDARLEGHRARVLSLPLRINGRVTGAAQFAANLENADAGVARLGRVLLVLLPIALVATSATGVWLTRRALRPMAEIADEAGRIEATNLSERLTVTGNDEFGHLADVFNSMLGRLEGSFRDLEEANASQRRFIADASHELKTPLTAIKTRLGVASRREQTAERYAEHLAAIERSANGMSSIVSDLLLLARADEGRLKIGTRLLPLDSLADEAVAVVEDVHGRKIEAQVEDGLLVRGDESGLSRVLVNLLDNAARHTPPDGRIRLDAEGADGHLLIRVSDTGAGIPPENLPHVFDRFYRVSTARDRETGGTGLGLAIVRSIVGAHGGNVSIVSEPGKGTAVTVELPASA